MRGVLNEAADDMMFSATHGASPTLEDDLGFPTIYAIARARRFLDGQGQKGKVSLLADGGLFTPGQFLKALALGADAVYIGTAAVMAMVSQQTLLASPGEPSFQLLLQTGRLREQFDPALGAASLVNFLKVAVQEMTAAMYAIGKTATSQLSTEDLCCLGPWLARALNVACAGVSPAEQAGYYQDTCISPAGARQPSSPRLRRCTDKPQRFSGIQVILLKIRSF